MLVFMSRVCLCQASLNRYVQCTQGKVKQCSSKSQSFEAVNVNIKKSRRLFRSNISNHASTHDNKISHWNQIETLNFSYLFSPSVSMAFNSSCAGRPAKQ